MQRIDPAAFTFWLKHFYTDVRLCNPVEHPRDCPVCLESQIGALKRRLLVKYKGVHNG